MNIFKFSQLVIFIALVIGCIPQAYTLDVPQGYRVVADYLENFSDKSESLVPRTIPADWTRQEDEKGNVSYSRTRENGGHKGCAIGHTGSQIDVRKGNDLVNYYDFIVTPQVKGHIRFWVARYSSSADPSVEVYKMAKTNNGFVCNPKTDLLFSVNDASWSNYNNSNPLGWTEQEFNVSNYEYLGFRISRAYIDEFEASYALVPGTTESISEFGGASDKVNKSSTNIGGNSTADGIVSEDKSGSVNKMEISKSNSKDRQANQNKQPSKIETRSPVTPYFTSNTLFMITNPSPNRFSQVTDSVFAIKTNDKYEFWTVTGEKIYDAIWASPKKYTTETPQFDGGVVAMRMAEPNANGLKPICLLYLDGSIRELDPSWEYVSKFEDGLALVEDERQDNFYINVVGEKVYPHLMVSRPINDQIRPVRDGLRAFYGKTEKYGNVLWGFIDTDGNIVIPPKYEEVTNFSDGYAWAVTENRKESIYAKELIDVKGNVVYKLPKYTSKTSDVVDGVFKEVEQERDVYRDTSGKELASFRDCTPFYDGYAFVQQALGDNVSVIDGNFKTVRELSNKILSDVENINFAPFGLATVRRYKVIAPNGDPIIENYETGFENRIGSFGQFSESGYATAEGFIDSERCFFYIKPTGEIAWMFSENPKSGGPWHGGRPPFPSPEPRDSIGDRLPRIPPVINEQPPKGPKTVDYVKFKIMAVAAPAEGGTVSITPAGTFRYNEAATLTAVPNNDWAVASVECNPRDNTKVEIRQPFKVTSDMTITVHFVKKDNDTAPEHTGCFLGTKIPPKDNEYYGKKEWEIPVYAEIGSEGTIENPYGNDNYGFLVLMYDPSTKYVSTGEDLSCNFFAVPLKICGFQHDSDGKIWMVVDGGSVTAANISSGSNPVSQMIFGAMLGSSGMSSVTTKPRHYRIEMRDIDPKTGEFTFGMLQTYSSKSGGWVQGGSNELTNTKSGILAKHSESGYPADMFEGVRMKISTKRNDVVWYPPQNWFDNKTLYDKTIEAMQEGYKSAKSDYDQLFSE